MTTACGNITSMLNDPNAINALWDSIYSELRHMAATLLANEKHQVDLQPSIVVSDLYDRLARAANQDPPWNDRKHFYGCAYLVMRQILVDHARKRNTLKRGGDRQRVPFDIAVNGLQTLTELPEDTEGIRMALDRLREDDALAFEIGWRRLAFGHTYRQIAEDLDIGETTARDNWRYAVAFLEREFDPDQHAT